jgi:hypothetical protein
MSKRYWMVHKPGTTCHYQHPTKDAALQEAARLARRDPGPFSVLEVVATVARPSGPPEYTPDEAEQAAHNSHDAPEIPF